MSSTLRTTGAGIGEASNEGPSGDDLAERVLRKCITNYTAPLGTLAHIEATVRGVDVSLAKQNVLTRRLNSHDECCGGGSRHLRSQAERFSVRALVSAQFK